MCLLNGGEAACTAGYIDHHDVTCGTLSSGSHYFRAHGSFYWPCPPVCPQSRFFVIKRNWQ